MASRPRDPVQFTRESAERIANVVRSHELAVPPASPLTFDAILSDGRRAKAVRRATFSGTWPIGSANRITFYNAGGATAMATNISWPMSLSYGDEPCLVGYDRGTWYLLVPRLEQASAVVVTGLTTGSYQRSISLAATFNTNNCTVSIAQTAVTATAIFITATQTRNYLRIRGVT